MFNFKKYLIDPKKVIIFILFFFTFFLGSNFIKKYPVVSDNYEYLQMGINFSLNNIISVNDHQDKNFRHKLDRSPAYSILISTLLNNRILKKNSKECFSNQISKDCEFEINKIQFFNLCTFVILVIFFYLICIQFINLYLSFFASIILSLNSFFLSQITHIAPEILSTLFITMLSFFIIKFYKSFNLFYLYFSFIILSFLIILKEVYIFLPFVIVTLMVSKFEFFRKKKNYFHILILLLLAYSLHTYWMVSNNLKKNETTNRENISTINIEDAYYLKNKSVFSTKSSSVIKQRAVYSTIGWDDYFALGSSFLPGNIGNKVLRNNFSGDQYLKFSKTINGRSFYHRNSTNLFLQELSKKNIDERNGFTLASILLIKKNFPMYLLQTPLFYLRGSFAPSGRIVFHRLFGKHKLLKLYLITNNLLHFVVIGGFFFFIFFLFFRNKIDIFLFIIISIPFYTLTFYSLFSHFISRYSVSIIPLCLLIFFIFISNTFNSKKN